MSSNINNLRDLCGDNQEALEYINALEEQLGDAEDALKEAENDLKLAQRESDDQIAALTTDIEEARESFAHKSVFLGLDTLHYRLENGNMKVAIQLEHWINQVKNQNAAGVQMIGGIS